MTRDEILRECKAQCAHCAAGHAAVSHLGGAEYIHSISNRGQHSVTMCQASDLRIKYREVLENG
jgi:hypothetical protein